jgi:hypothetical protein
MVVWRMGLMNVISSLKGILDKSPQTVPMEKFDPVEDGNGSTEGAAQASENTINNLTDLTEQLGVSVNATASAEATVSSEATITNVSGVVVGNDPNAFPKMSIEESEEAVVTTIGADTSAFASQVEMKTETTSLEVYREIAGDEYDKVVAVKDMPSLIKSEFAKLLAGHAPGVGVSDMKVVTVTKSAVEPLTPITVNDGHGRISAIIYKMEQTSGARITPAAVTNIPSFATPRDHKDFHVGKGRYFYDPKTCNAAITETVQSALQELAQGNVVKIKLCSEVKVDDKSAVTFHHTPEEVKDIMTYLAEYRPKLIDAKGDLMIIVGDYIYE